jgi:uncharacterized protein YndB with AHSA1/START domain
VIRLAQERLFHTPVEQGFSVITDVANWPAYWPGLVRVQAESRWHAPGDQARVVIRLLGREVQLTMTLREFIPNQLVAYESVQSGLPDARHERHFRPFDRGFLYRIVIEYQPRRGLRGLVDRTVVRRGIERAIQQTMDNLERLLGPD